MLFLTGLISCLVVSVLIKHCRVQSSASAVVMVTLLFGALQSLTPQQSFEEPARWFVSAVKITFCSDFSETAAAFPRISNLTDFFPDTTMESSYFTFRLCRKSLRGHNFLSPLLAFMVLLCQYHRSQSLGVKSRYHCIFHSFWEFLDSRIVYLYLHQVKSQHTLVFTLAIVYWKSIDKQHNRGIIINLDQYL